MGHYLVRCYTRVKELNSRNKKLFIFFYGPAFDIENPENKLSASFKSIKFIQNSFCWNDAIISAIQLKYWLSYAFYCQTEFLGQHYFYILSATSLGELVDFLIHGRVSKSKVAEMWIFQHDNDQLVPHTTHVKHLKQAEACMYEPPCTYSDFFTRLMFPKHGYPWLMA